MIRAITFDLDNTLIDRDRAFRECVDEAVVDPRSRSELIRLDQRGHEDRQVLLDAWHGFSGRRIDLDQLGALIAERLSPMEEVIDALRELASRIKIGLISNGGSSTQRRKLTASGLVRAFAPDKLWISGEVGSAKPDPLIFRRAASSMGLPPEQCLHVGDHPIQDFSGACHAGWQAHLVTSALTAVQIRNLAQP